MRELNVFVCAVIMAVVLLPCYASAQGTDPPTCCNITGQGLRSLSSGGSQATAGSPNQVVISDESLRAMGLSRSDFVDRLAESLFFRGNVDVVISVESSIQPRTRALRASASRAEASEVSEGTLLAVQEKRWYQIPRSMLRTAELEALDRLYITNGQIYIEVTFKRVESSAATR